MKQSLAADHLLFQALKILKDHQSSDLFQWVSWSISRPKIVVFKRYGCPKNVPKNDEDKQKTVAV